MALIETYQEEQIAHSIDHIGQKYGLKRFKEEGRELLQSIITIWLTLIAQEDRYCW